MPEIKLEDLVQRCEHCGGTGADPVISDPPTSLGEFGIVPGGMSAACEQCHGLGGIPTPTGELLRDFVRWLKRTDRETTDGLSGG